MAAARATAWRTFADARLRTVTFAVLFAFSAYVQPTAYRDSYPTLAERLQFARSFGDNDAVRLLYGKPYDLLSVGGYVAWRTAGVLAIFAALWSLLSVVRATRADEDAGRTEMLLAGGIGRSRMLAAQVAAIAAGAGVLWATTLLALIAGGLPAAGSALLAAATVSPVPVFVGIGLVASQVAAARRLAIGLAAGALGVAFALRVVADTTDGLATLRWLTPLGWSEEVRPFAGSRPLVLLLPLLSGAVLVAVAAMLQRRRDIGSGLLPAHDRSRARIGLLGTPTRQALRDQRGVLLAWLLAVTAFGVLVGVLSDSVSAGLSADAQRQLAELGARSIATPAGYLGFTFLFFLLAVSVFCCTQLAAARREEAEQRLEMLLALPVARVRWLGGRLVLATAAAATLALIAGAAAWAGAAAAGAGVSLARLLEAGANCLPAALLFLALGAVAFAVAPRAGTAIAYSLVGAAFMWQLMGELLDAPAWLLGLSPFHHVALVPAEPFRGGDAVVMLAVAAIAVLTATRVFARRDLTGA